MAVEPNKWGIIYNPKAGTRRVKKRWIKIKEYLDSKDDVSYDYVQSEGFGSVERLAKMFANSGYKKIVIVGGDGALNDVINGIMHSDVEDKSDISIGLIPNGIGNDFARYWDISNDFKQAVDVIIANKRLKIDVGIVTFNDGRSDIERFFLNAVNIGLGGHIFSITDKAKRFWGVKVISYLVALFLLLFRKRRYRVSLKINDELIKKSVMTVCVGNARGWGQTPSAVPYNGWLDVSVIKYSKFFDTIWGLVMLIRKRILNHKDVRCYRTQKVEILKAEFAPIDLDGRMLEKHTPITIGIMKKAITFIIP